LEEDVWNRGAESLENGEDFHLSMRGGGFGKAIMKSMADLPKSQPTRMCDDGAGGVTAEEIS